MTAMVFYMVFCSLGCLYSEIAFCVRAKKFAPRACARRDDDFITALPLSFIPEEDAAHPGTAQGIYPVSVTGEPVPAYFSGSAGPLWGQFAPRSPAALPATAAL